MARALLAGPWDLESLSARAREAVLVAGDASWIARLAARTLACFPAAPRARIDRLAAFVRAELPLPTPRLARVFIDTPRGEPAHERIAAAGLPRPDTLGDLAAWLELDDRELVVFSDPRGLERSAPRDALRNYVRRWVPKRSGGARLLEAPKPGLKALQRRILAELLSLAPPHDAAHGFRRGRSVASFVAPHVGRRVLVRVDLEDFFASIRASRVVATFVALGYPIDVARALAGLVTTRAPTSGAHAPPIDPRASMGELTALAASRMRYRTPHLPQGAPTSPALANLAAYRLDLRLTAAAIAMGARYTRYADDLALSSDEPEIARRPERLVHLASAIAYDEGFSPNPRKTRVLRRSVRQTLGGLVVNERPSPSRADRDRLEAILMNAVRRGPAGENRACHPNFRAHLRGRVAHVAAFHAAHGARLLALFERIEWPSDDG